MKWVTGHFETLFRSKNASKSNASGKRRKGSGVLSKLLQLWRSPAIYAVGFFAFICWIIFLADSGRQSVFFDFVSQLPFGDKLGHAGLFGVLALLANLSFGFRYWNRPWIQLGSLTVLAFALGEELTQYFFPNRTLDPVDAAADIVGVALATLVSLGYRSFTKKT